MGSHKVGHDRSDLAAAAAAAIKKKEILPFVRTWMDLKVSISEMSQTMKDKYCIIPLICAT